MKLRILFFLFILTAGAQAALFGQEPKTRIFVVSSYSPDYLWSQDTNKGVCAALLDFKFLDDPSQVETYTRNDYVETGKTVIKKAWMDTKRKSGRDEIVATTERIVLEIRDFKPDLILLGDDNAANYIGNKFLDTKIPVVFWGVDGFALKYGLMESLAKPGHNVTGVYQPGYYREGLEAVAKLLPAAKTFAILSDASETGKGKVLVLHKMAEQGVLPLKLIEKAVVTSSYSQWQQEALRLREIADVLFIPTHHTLKDDDGKPVEAIRAAAWYLRNIRKPEVVPEKHLVLEGMLLCADDSGYKQGYEAVRIANMILREKKNPAGIPATAPARGSILVNRERARMLGIDLAGRDFIEEYAEKALALDQVSQ